MTNQTPIADSMARDLFVGQRWEMETLRAILDDLLAGRGGLVMLVGEPGIGQRDFQTELSFLDRPQRWLTPDLHGTGGP